MKTQPELLIRPSAERFHSKRDWLDSWHTFSFAGHHDPNWMGFGPLLVINDDTIAAGQGFGMHPHRDMEIVSIVLEGELAHEDSLGNGSVIRPGDVQRMSAGSGILHRPDPHVWGEEALRAGHVQETHDEDLSTC